MAASIIERFGRALVPATRPRPRTAAYRSLGDMSPTELITSAWDRVSEWSTQASEAVRANGTLYNHLTSISSLAADGHWEAVRVDGPIVTLDDDYRATRFVESLASFDIGRTVRRIETVGAHWMIPWPDEEALIRWDEASTSELFVPYDASRAPEITRHAATVRQALYPMSLSPSKRPAVIRLWRPDDEWRDQPWSPVASVLHHIEALHLMDLAEMALDRNRLASAGILFIPNDIAGIDQKDASKSVTFARITKAAQSAIRDPNSVASVVPVFLTGPGASGAHLRHLITERREDPVAFQARRDAHLRELARALSSPAGRVLGTEDQAKYANAAAMDFDTLRTFLPAVTKAVVDGVNALYREIRTQWGMPTRGYMLRLSFEHLKPRENRTQEALDLRNAGAITMEGVQEMAEIPEEWRLKMGTAEYELWREEQTKAALALPVAQDKQKMVDVTSSEKGKPPAGYAVPKVAAAPPPPLGVADIEALLGLEAHVGGFVGVTDAEILAIVANGQGYVVRRRDRTAAIEAPQFDPSTLVTLRVASDSLEAAGGLAKADQHMTLVYMGETPGAGMADIVEAWANLVPPIAATVSSVTVLGNSVSTLVGTTQPLIEYVTHLRRMLRAADARWESKYDFIPHVALAYDTEFQPENSVVGASIRFDRVQLHTVEGDTVEFPLSGVAGDAFPETMGAEPGRLGALDDAMLPAVDWSAVLAELAAIDKRLHDRIAAAADHGVQVALRKAGVKVWNKATASQRLTLADVPHARRAAALGPAALDGLKLSADDLVANAADDLIPVVAGYIDEAQADAEKVLRKAWPGFVAAAAVKLRDWRAAALAAFSSGFVATVRSLLHNPDPFGDAMPGEQPASKMSLPARIIAAAVALAGGHQPPSLDAPLVGGPGQGAQMFDVLADAGKSAAVAYEWRHALHGTPLTVFEPHEERNGNVYASMEDPSLLVDPFDQRTAWLGTMYLSPGDHAFCTCGWIVVHRESQ